MMPKSPVLRSTEPAVDVVGQTCNSYGRLWKFKSMPSSVCRHGLILRKHELQVGGWLGEQVQKRSHDASLQDRTKAAAAATATVMTAVMVHQVSGHVIVFVVLHPMSILLTCAIARPTTDAKRTMRPLA